MKDEMEQDELIPGMTPKKPVKMNPKPASPSFKKVGEGIYEVQSFTNPTIKYTVDIVLRTCTCPYFETKHVECKHLKLVDGGKEQPEKKDWEGKTKGGYVLDEVVSSLQKEIRRGKEKQAVWWASELVESGMWKYLFRRLMVICGEDIGHANPEAMILVTSVYQALMTQMNDSKQAWWKPDNNIYQFVVGYLARSPKSRHVDYLGGVILKVKESGYRLEIPDYAVDEHTKSGKELGRGDAEFFREGSRIKNKKAIEGEDEIKSECLKLYGFKEKREENEF